MKINNVFKIIGVLLFAVIIIAAIRPGEDVIATDNPEDKEYAAYEQLESIGLTPLYLEYLPEGAFFREARVIEEGKRGILTYYYDEKVITITYGKAYENSTTTVSLEVESITSVYNVNLDINIDIIGEVEYGKYFAMFDYSGTSYLITGVMSEEDFVMLITNLVSK